MIASPAPPIVFFDGECGLCARSVRWLLRHDRRGTLRFAPLQGETYAALEAPEKPDDLGSMVLWDGTRLHVRSDGVLHSLDHIGGPWPALGRLARLLPRALRDAAYRFVAARRFRWFGTTNACVAMSPSERERLLK